LSVREGENLVFKIRSERDYSDRSENPCYHGAKPGRPSRILTEN
jgi:hypothetical protein